MYVFKSGAKRFLFFCFDLLGSLLFFIPSRLRPALQPSRIQKILVVRLDHLGDVVMTRPPIHALRRRFPDAQIDLLVSSAAVPLLKEEAGINEILVMKHDWFSKAGFFEQWSEAFRLLPRLKQGGYDLGIDFRGDLRNIFLMALAGIPERFGYGITGGGFLLTSRPAYRRGVHQVLLNQEILKPLGIESAEKNIPFAYSENRKARFWESVGRLLPQGSKKRIVLHPGAGYASKRWNKEKVKSLIMKIFEENRGEIVLIGTESEKREFDFGVSDARLFDLRGKTSLEDLPVLLDACRLYIGNDSGPSHIAAAQGIPLIVLFSGTNDAAVWRPWSASLQLVRYEVPCSPCEARECPLKHHDCMEKISVQAVMEKVRAVLP